MKNHMFDSLRCRRWLAAALLCTVFAPGLSAQTGFGTQQDHLEQVYGHALTAENLAEISSWRRYDGDWWTDEERNLESWAKLREVHHRASNSAQLLVDPRAHEELFGVTLQPADASGGLGTLVFDVQLRPDLYTITDLISRELDPLFENQLAFHADALNVRKELREVMKGLKVPEVFPWLVTAEQTQRLVTSSIEGDAALFVEAALAYLYSEAMRSSTVVAEESLTKDFQIEDQLRAYAGTDLRVEYVRLLGDRELQTFQASLARASAFLQALNPVHRSFFLRHLLETRAAGMLTGIPLVAPVENHDFFDALDLELRGLPKNYAQQTPPPQNVTQSASGYWFQWTQGPGQRTKYDPEVLDQIEYFDGVSGLCEVAASGSIGFKNPQVKFSMKVGGTLEIYLRSLIGTVEWNPSLRNTESGQSYPAGGESRSCFFGRGRQSGGDGLSCSVTMTAPEPWEDLTEGGSYEIVPNAEARTSLALPATFNGLPWAHQLNITASLAGQNIAYQQVQPGAARVWTIQRSAMMRGPLSWGYRSATASLRTCCPSGDCDCAEGLEWDVSTGTCECPPGLYGPFDDEPICKTLCELRPEVCQSPEIRLDETLIRRISVRDELPELLPLIIDRVGETSVADTCIEMTTMVCIEYYDYGLETYVVECGLELVCVPRAGKTIDCSESQWWPYCDGWTLMDEMPADILAAAACTQGSQRCRGAGETQTCQGAMWSWRGSESCPFGCDPQVQACIGQIAQCSGFETRCVNGGSAVQLCNGGLWGDVTPCANGCDSQTNQCSSSAFPACTNGAIRCVNGGTAAQTCEGGQWGSVATCPGGCDVASQQCAAGGPQCADGQRRCVNNGASVQFCQSGAWGSEQYCPYGCDDITLQCNATSTACSGTYPNRCTSYGARTCSSAGDALSCEPAAPNGCLTWQVAETCPQGCTNGVCAGATCTGTDVCSVDGARRCLSASQEELCSIAGDGCLRWGAPLGGGTCDTASGDVCSNGLCQQVQCLFNSDCAASSRFCDAGTCAPCSTSSDCSPGYSCHSNGRCQIVF